MIEFELNNNKIDKIIKGLLFDSNFFFSFKETYIHIWNFRKNQKKDIPWKLFQLFSVNWLAEIEVSDS